MKKKLISMLLCLCMVATLLPTIAFAEDAGEATIQLGTAGISGYNSNSGTSSYDIVYYGEWDGNPIPWRVLDTKTNMDNAQEGDGLFLLSEILFDGSKVYFDNTEPVSNTWQGSDAQNWCNTFETKNLSGLELAAILGTNKDDDQYRSTSNTDVAFAAATGILHDDQVFFLSVEEVENSKYGFTVDTSRMPGTNSRSWWLRSPKTDISSYAGLVNQDGGIESSHVDTKWAARPAFNLDPDSVLFISLTTSEGKNSGVGADALVAVHVRPNVASWKLTLKDYDDDNNNLSATLGHDGFTAKRNGSGSVEAGSSVSVDYSGAATGENEYISAMIVNSSDEVLYYGNIVDLSANGASASGTQSITIPAGLAAGDYTLKIFNEQAHVSFGETDYASAFSNIPLTVTVPSVYSIEAAPASLDFGSDYTGYAQPSPQTVTITNTGNQEVTVDLPTSSKFTITAGTGFSGEPAKAVLAADDGTATFTVTPKTGLDVGTHNETITVSGTNSTSTSFAAAFSVQQIDEVEVYPYYPYYYTLTFETNSGSTIASVLLEEYTTVNLDGYTPTKDGYTFTGWYSDAELTEKITGVRMTKSTTIYAGWNRTIPDAGAWVNPFADVSENDWFFDDVAIVNLLDLMNGTGGTTFSPHSNASRGMIVTILYRLDGSPAVTGTNPFDDVPGGMYYTDAIIWAAGNGVMDGYGDGKFGPEDAITREQMAVMLYRYAQFKGYDVTAKADLSKFTDEDSISEYAIIPLSWANACELIDGVGSDLLDPKGTAERCQVAAVLHRFCENIVK